MSESGDYDPGPWTGYDFKSARKVYDAHVGRSYDDAVAKGKDLDDVRERSLKTNSESPLVIAVDVTGSMGDWPATIFSKLPYLEKEGQEYLGENMEISFAATGDAYSDQYPLQVRKFSKGKDLEKRLKELVIEGNGGGQTTETYEITGLYYAKNVEMPKAVRPIMIFIGDEGLYDSVSKDTAKDVAGVAIEGRAISTEEIFKDLKQKFSVYLVRKPYERGSGDSMSSTDQRIYNQWEKLLGADHISVLPDPNRVVDVIFGILAKETGRIDYFKDELTDRQRPDQVKTVLKSLNSIHTPNKSVRMLRSGASMMKKSGGGKDATSLL